MIFGVGRERGFVEIDAIDIRQLLRQDDVIREVLHDVGTRRRNAPHATRQPRKERQPRSLQHGTFNNLVGDIIDLRNANRPHRIVNKIHLLLLREIWLVLKKRLPQKLLPVHPRGGIVDSVDN